MKKYAKQIISGAVLFILGGIIVPVISFVFLFSGLLKQKPLAKFVTPAEVELTIENKGKYYLWNEYQTTFEGRTYSTSENLPDGIKISLTDLANGNDIELITDFSISSSSTSSKNNSIGYFKIEKPGKYILNVAGDSSPRVLSFGTSLFGLNFFLTIITVFLLEMSMGIGGFVLIVIGIINLAKAGKTKNSIPPAASAVNSP